MKILHISTRLILGGSQENTVLSCEGQARLGHEVHLAFGPIYGPEGSLLERVERFNAEARAGGKHLPITTHVLPHMVREIHPFKDHICFHHELRPLIRTLKPDIVHTHSSKAGILGRWAAWKEGGAAGKIGVIHTIHGPPFMPVEGGAVHRAKVRAMNLAYTLAERFAAQRCHTIVSVADAMTREFLARGIGDAAQYTTVRSGMDVQPFLTAAPGEDRAAVRASLGLTDADFVVGTVARLAQHKGHDDLLDALADDLRGNPHWKLLWVGDGWWKDRLMAKAESMGLRRQVLLTGLVPPERIPAMVRAMDVLAHPSYREGLPRTVPQALLCGVCPVAYNVDGTGEACREMETGRLVRVGDLAGLRSAIAWCAENPQERAALAARGRDECRGAFSAGEMVRCLELVYAGAVSGKGGSSRASSPA
ncbi:MAG: glycosyltransferase [Phycisphaerales bacterium]